MKTIPLQTWQWITLFVLVVERREAVKHMLGRVPAGHDLEHSLGSELDELSELLVLISETPEEHDA